MAKAKQTAVTLRSDMFDADLTGQQFVGQIYVRAMALRDRKTVEGVMVETEPTMQARYNAYLVNFSNKLKKLKRMVESHSLSTENFQAYVRDMMAEHMIIMASIDFIPSTLLPSA